MSLPRPDEKKDVPLAANSFTFGTRITEASLMSPFRFTAPLTSPLSAAGYGLSLSQQFTFDTRNTNDGFASSFSSSNEESFRDHSPVGASEMPNSNLILSATTQVIHQINFSNLKSSYHFYISHYRQWMILRKKRIWLHDSGALPPTLFAQFVCAVMRTYAAQTSACIHSASYAF